MVEINSVKFGEVTVDHRTYYSDVIIWWDGRVEYRSKKHVFDLDELLKLMKRKPDAIVIGTGINGGMRITPEVSEMAETEKFRFHVALSPDAMDIFNGLVLQKKKPVTLIHTTC
jgi:hypothetical protein